MIRSAFVLSFVLAVATILTFLGELEYLVDQRSLLKLQTTPAAATPKCKSAIVTLTGSGKEDIQDLCSALDSLRKLPDENLSKVVVFHEGDLSKKYQTELTKCTERTLTFGLVDFDDFPAGFDPSQEKSVWNKRSPFGYMQMIRFFVTGLWRRPEIQDCETVMRLDSDACWRGQQVAQEKFLPSLADGKVYHANRRGNDGAKYCAGIFELAQEFVKQHNITIGAPRLWEDFREKYEKPVCKKKDGSDDNAKSKDCEPARKCLTFYNNFEVSRVSFFHQPLVEKWHTLLTDQEPFGVLRHRWGDAVVRFLTMAMFANESSLELRSPKTYSHPCKDKTQILRHEHLIDLS